MNSRLKEFAKRALSAVLSAALLFGAAGIPGYQNTQSPYAATTSTPLDKLKWNLDEEHDVGYSLADRDPKEAGKKIDFKKSIELHDAAPDAFENLSRLEPGDDIYEWVMSNDSANEGFGGADGPLGNNSKYPWYGARIDKDKTYSVIWKNVRLYYSDGTPATDENGDQLPAIDIKYSVSNFKGSVDISDFNEDADWYPGPYIVFSSRDFGWTGKNRYKRQKYTLTITDHNSDSLSIDHINASIRIADIDMHQAVEVRDNKHGQQMVTGGSYGIRLVQATSSKLDDITRDDGRSYKKFLEEEFPDTDPKDVLVNYGKYNGSYSDQDTSSDRIKDIFGVKLNLKFTAQNNYFEHYFYAGNDGDTEWGGQRGWVFTFFDAALSTDKDEPPVINPSPVAKKIHINGTDTESVILDAAAAGQPFEFRISNTISSGNAKNIRNDLVDLNKYGFEDQVEGCFEVTGKPYVTLGSDTVSSFDTSGAGNNHVTAYMNAAGRKEIQGGTYVLHIPVKLKEGTDLSKYYGSRRPVSSNTAKNAPYTNNNMAYAEIPNGCEMHFETDQEQDYTVAYGYYKDAEHSESSYDPEIHDYVHVYWKPDTRPDPVKTVDKDVLTRDADESWTYTVTQKMPANTWPYGYIDTFSITDQVDPLLVIDQGSIRLLSGDQDITSGFDVTVSGNRIVAVAKDTLKTSDSLYGKGTAKDIRLVYDVSFNKSYENGGYLGRMNQVNDDSIQGQALTDGTVSDRVNTDETVLTEKNNAQVNIKWDAWGEGWQDNKTTGTVSTSVDIPHIEKPSKTVTDDDEQDQSSNTLTDADEVWTYTITQKIPPKTASIYRYAKLEIHDEIDKCLTIGRDIKSGTNNEDDISIEIDGKDVKSLFDLAVGEDNKIDITAHKDLLSGGNDNLLYGGEGLAGATITVKIPVHIFSGGDEGGQDASNEAKLKELRSHGHFNEGDDETRIVFTNKAYTVVDDMISVTGTALDSGETTTTLNCPQITAPVKNVSDTDDLNWDHSIARKGEADHKGRDKNRISDSTREWTYTITQELPAHNAPLFYHKSWYFQDEVDACLEYDPEDVVVTVGGEDCTKDFTVEKLEGNILKATAHDSLLKDGAFYGNKKGTAVVIQFPVHINQQLGQTLYDTSGLKAHGHLTKDEDGHDVYQFMNGDKDTVTKTVIDNLLKVGGNMKEDGLTTNEDTRLTGAVTTQAEVSEPVLTKEADRFEWEVGENVKYTLRITNRNPMAIMDRVTVTDNDLPDCMQLVPEANGPIVVYARGATENFSAPGDEEAIADPRAELLQIKAEEGKLGSTLTKDMIFSYRAEDLDDITKKCEVEFYNDKGRTGNGFTLMVPKQYRGEEIFISFTCRITEEWNDCEFKTGNCCNGSVVENTASLTSTLMYEDEPVDDTEHIWVNTPHLSVEKINGTWDYENGKYVRKDQDETNYRNGDDVHYSLLVQNEHPGTLARDVKISDRIETDGLSYNPDSIKVYRLYTNAKGNRVKTDVTGRIDPDDIQFSLDNKEFTIRTGFTLRYDGETPFNEAVAENVHNRIYELGLSPDDRIPGLKRLLPEAEEGRSVWENSPQGYETALKNGYDDGSDGTAGAWKSFRTVMSHPQEWLDADVGYIVEYTAKITKGISASETLRNTAETDAENADPASDNHMITGQGPAIRIDKVSDRAEYMKGDTGRYFLEVTNPTRETIAKNVVIKDALKNSEAKIDTSSIRVYYFDRKEDAESQKAGYLAGEELTGEDITSGCVIPENTLSDNGYYINTNRDLDTKGAVVVTYNVDLSSDALVDAYVPNVAAAKADNAFPELDEGTQTVSLGQMGLEIRKMSDPYTGVTVKQGQEITYTLEVKNTTSTDKKNVLVRDLIPELTAYVDGSAAVLKDKDGGLAQMISLGGKDAVGFVLPVLHAYETKKMQFGVTVNDEAQDEDIIRNVAEVYEPGEGEMPEIPDGSYPDEVIKLFSESAFVQTNATLHPLSYWTVDDNLVHVKGSSIIPVKEADKKEYYAGEKIHYTVSISAGQAGFKEDNLVLDDAFEDEGYAVIDADSLKVTWSKDGTEEDITKEVGIDAGQYGFHIDFGRPFTYHDRVTVKYDATALKETVINDKEGLANDSRWNDKYGAKEIVKITDPALRISKTAEPVNLIIGQEASYQVKVSQPTDRGVIKNLMVEDAMEQPGLITIREDSIKVKWNGTSLDDAVITLNEAKDGYTIETGKDLTTEDELVIEYAGIPTDAAVAYTKEHGQVNNTAYAYGADDPEDKVRADAFVKVTDPDNWLAVSKESDRKTYSVTTPEMVKNGNPDTAHYTVKIENRKDGVAREVSLEDAFLMKGMQIDPASIKIVLVNAEHPHGQDVTGDVAVEAGDTGYRIDTGMNLGLNDSFTVTYDVIFTEPMLAGCDIINTAVAHAVNCEDAEDSNTVTVKVPDLVPEKSSDAVSYSVGQKGHYTAVFTQKEKDIRALNVVITDHMSAPVDGFYILKDTIRVSDSSGNDITEKMKSIEADEDSIRIETGMDLDYNEKFTLEYDVDFREEMLDGTAVNNIVSVRADNAPEMTSANPVSITGMEICKRSDPASGSYVCTGDEITYFIDVKNTSDAVLENVLVRDRIPDGTAWTGGGDIIQVNGNDYVTFPVESIGPDETVTLQFTVKVTAEGPATITNTAQVKAVPDSGDADFTSNDGWQDTNQVIHYVPVPDSDGLTGFKSSDPVSGTEVRTPVYEENGKASRDDEGNIRYENDEITYNITIRNTSDKDIENVAVRDRIPEGTKWIEGGEVITISDTDYAVFKIDKIKAGTAQTVSFKVKVTAQGFTEIRNFAEFKAFGSNAEIDWDDKGFTPTNTVIHPVPRVVEVMLPELKITKTSDKKVYNLGETGKYTVEVKNTKEGTTAKNVVIDDAFRIAGVQIQADTIRISDTAGNDITGNGTVKIETGEYGYTVNTGMDLAYGESFTVTYDVIFRSETLAGRTVPNVARAKADNAAARAENEADIPWVDAGDKLLVKKTSVPASGTRVKAGQTIRYHILINNDGDREKNNILVLDMIPEFTTYVEGSAKFSTGKTENTKEGFFDKLIRAVTGLVSDGSEEESTGITGEGNTVFLNGTEYISYVVPSIKPGEYCDLAFDVVVSDSVTEDDCIFNTALVKTAEDEDTEDPATWNPVSFVKTNTTVHPLGPWAETIYEADVTAPELAIEKYADKKVYREDETAHYTVKVTNIKADTTAKNVVIRDELKTEGALIAADSIKITDDSGKDITGAVKISKTDTSYDIDTGMDLGYEKSFTVTYDVRFTGGSAIGKKVINIAKAKADNAYAETSNDVTPVTVEDNLTAVKTSDPKSGTVVKPGQEITYHITVKNDGTEDKAFIYVMDEIPEHTSYVEGSGGELLEVNGRSYVTFMIPQLGAGKDETMSFKVTVSEDAGEDDVIRNTALVSMSHETEPEDPWKPEEFVKTNEVRHPLGRWVEDDEDVTVSGNKPELAVKKESDKASYDVGDTGIYNVTVSQKNAGQTAHNVVITDTLQTDGAYIQTDSIKVYKKNTKETATTGETVVEGSDGTDYVPWYIVGEQPDKGQVIPEGNYTLYGTTDANGWGSHIVITKKDSSIEGFLGYEDDSTSPLDGKKVVLEKGDTIMVAGTDIRLTADDGTVYILSDTYDGRSLVEKHDAGDDTEISNGSASDVSTIPQGAADITGNVQITATSKGYNIITNDTLSYGEQLVVVYTVLFKDESLAGKETVNIAGAKADETEEVKADHKVPVNKDGQAKLSITKTSGKKSYKPGGTGKYTIVIKNISDVTAENVHIHDEFTNKNVVINPDSLTLTTPDKKQHKLTLNSEDGKFAYGFDGDTDVDLKKGESLKLTYTTTFPKKSSAGKNYVNKATASAKNANPVKAKNTVTISSGSSKDKDKDNKDSKMNKNSSSVKTSDILFLMLLAAAAVLGVTGLVYLRKKKHQA